MNWRKTAFFLLITFCLTPYAFPPVAFAAGLTFALIFENPYPQKSKKYGKILFTISVIFSGFGLTRVDFKNSLTESYILLISAVILTLFVGFLLVKFLKTKRKTYPLISAAVAVGGENTISAVSPAINIEEKDLSAAVAVIFLINLTAIFVFPIAGYLLNLTVYQYGVWTAIAIPDTLFALNSAATFGADSLLLASANNLVRLLFLIPTACIFAYLYNDEKSAKPAIPWLLFLFFITFLIRYLTPLFIPPSFYDSFVNLAKAGLTITIFLTAVGFSRQTLRDAGIKPLIFGFLLWSLLAIAALIAVIRLIKF